jgi:hypothetical protein
MISKTKIAFSAAIWLSGVLAVAASSLPNIDVQEACRASVDGSFADKTDNFDVCMRDEREARARLVEDWADFFARDKARCILPAEYLPGYVEWLTCLELERHLRSQRQGKADAPAAHEAKAYSWQRHD